MSIESTYDIEKKNTIITMMREPTNLVSETYRVSTIHTVNSQNSNDKKPIGYMTFLSKRWQ